MQLDDLKILKTLPLTVAKLSPAIAFAVMMTVVGYSNLQNCDLNPDIPQWIFIAGIFYERFQSYS